MVTQATATVTCSTCGKQFRAPVQRILDAGKDPSAKTRLLQGRINVAACPYCGAAGRLNTPFAYHDPGKQLLFVFSPVDLTVSEPDRQRLIGDLTKSVMDSLPPEQRRAYLFQPAVFFTYPSLIDRILDADGITKEMREAQRARMEVLNSVLAAATDRDSLKRVVEEKKPLIDKQFFDLFFTATQNVAAEGQVGLAEEMLALYSLAADLAGVPEAKETLRKAAQLSRKQVRKRLEEAKTDDELDAVVATTRPAIDYQFFQELTADIDSARQAGDAEKAKNLTELRSRILEASDRIDEAAQETMQQVQELIQAALGSKEPEALLRSRLSDLDEAFFAILSASAQAAEAEGKREAAVRFSEIAEIALRLVRENMPPEIAFINSLLQAKYPEGVKALLSEKRDLVTPEVLDAIRQLQQDLARMGRQDVAQRMGDIYAMAQGPARPTLVTGR